MLCLYFFDKYDQILEKGIRVERFFKGAVSRDFRTLFFFIN